MKIEIGLDIIEILRIKEKCIKGSGFENKIFTQNELPEAQGENYYSTLSGKWAAKEAFSKALSTGFGKDLDFKDMEILKEETGKPYIKAKQEIMERFRIKSISVSISHCELYAAASVLIIFNQ